MSKRTQSVLEVGGMILAVVLIISLIYGLWLAGKWVSYTFIYEDSVKNTVCSMVKSEHLKNPEECIK